MVHDAAKTIHEGDAEVSEACDFARYYAASAGQIGRLETEGVDFTPLGTVVVASPWNFPFAIPAGGVLAALAAGNAVILKPAPESVLTAWLVAGQCWEAGVPADVLQFLPCPDDEVGQALISHDEVDAVILTGSYETASMFLSWKPGLRLHAETSGKNAMIITAAADIDLAVKDLVHSAFSHSGQKCSAASLAIVEARVYDDPAFRAQLADAVISLKVGPPGELDTVIGPLVRAPRGPLLSALSSLEEGEQWLVQPRADPSNPHLWTPAVKLGVRPGSPFHQTECFGPVLGVIRAENLDQAIDWQNATPFGLTGAIHSLDPTEISHWLERVQVGNAYVNRGTTGAIVNRQPFGGWKRSVVGPTFKAGGPNYVLSLGRWATNSDVDPECFARSIENWWKTELAIGHDPSKLTFERNVLRYVPLPDLVFLRAGGDATDDQVALALAAAAKAGVTVAVSSPRARPRLGDDFDVEIRVEGAGDLAARLLSDRVETAGGRNPLPSGLRRPEVARVVSRRPLSEPRAAGTGPGRIRLLGEPEPEVVRAASSMGWVVDDAPAVAHGLLELLRWVREQAISETAHRHGNLTGGVVTVEPARPSAAGPGGASSGEAPAGSPG
jgi:RHH-type proline utilization regulon transcriptional repressor/proline dehydrogenase/delta 1-pyrroline-5-carboxylate dehydrogenase